MRQHARKVTGRRPDYGALSMRETFLPAAAAKEEEVMRFRTRWTGSPIGMTCDAEKARQSAKDERRPARNAVATKRTVGKKR